MPRADRRRGSAAPLLGLVVLVAVFAVLIKVVMALVDGSSPIQVPVAEQCTVTVGDVSDSLDLDASENAAVIVAEGMHTVTSVPRPSWLSMVTVPWCRLTKLSTMERPRPAPPWRPWLSKRLNTVFSTSCGMPGPRSETVKTRSTTFSVTG